MKYVLNNYGLECDWAVCPRPVVELLCGSGWKCAVLVYSFSDVGRVCGSSVMSLEREQTRRWSRISVGRGRSVSDLIWHGLPPIGWRSVDRIIPAVRHVNGDKANRLVPRKADLDLPRAWSVVENLARVEDFLCGPPLGSRITRYTPSVARPSVCLYRVIK